jgi:hypothetical protein
MAGQRLAEISWLVTHEDGLFRPWLQAPGQPHWRPRFKALPAGVRRKLGYFAGGAGACHYALADCHAWLPSQPAPAS